MVSDDTKNEQELEGMVVDLIQSLGRKEEELLEESYGDVSKAQIFEIGGGPTARRSRSS